MVSGHTCFGPGIFPIQLTELYVELAIVGFQFVSNLVYVLQLKFALRDCSDENYTSDGVGVNDRVVSKLLTARSPLPFPSIYAQVLQRHWDARDQEVLIFTPVVAVDRGFEEAESPTLQYDAAAHVFGFWFEFSLSFSRNGGGANCSSR